jgi:hypothetical protein
MMNKKDVDQFHENMRKAKDDVANGKPMPFFKEYFFINDGKSCDIDTLPGNPEADMKYIRDRLDHSFSFKLVIPIGGKPSLWKRFLGIFKKK